MLVSNKALTTSMPYRHRRMVEAAALRLINEGPRPYKPYTTPAAKPEPYNAHIEALVEQDFGYLRPWWEVYGDEPTPSETELSKFVQPSNSPEAIRFRSYYAA